MTEQPDDPRRLRARLAVLLAAAADLRADVVQDPDRHYGFRVAEEAREGLRVASGAFADAKGEVLDLAAQEQALDLAGLTEIAGGVSRQRVSKMVNEARGRAAAPTREEQTG